jgi:hypothetical protein
VLHHAALALKLLVEGEDGPLSLVVHVADTPTACGIAAVVGVGEGSARCGPRCCCGGGHALGVDVCYVACSAAASVDVVAGGDGGVGLSDAVRAGDHFKFVVVRCEVVMRWTL